MRLSVVIPVHNGGDDLRCCLRALATSARPADEVIVVDDASTDGSGDLAWEYGAQVVHLNGAPQGPAFARNRGAEVAKGDVLVFLDADVAVHPDTLTRIEHHLSEHPEISALFGSYDADPPGHSLVTRYKNLLHHYVHQHSRREASTFWAGCGAIRRDVFAAHGGFDEGYRRPSIEDIELGVRLRRSGHQVRLCPDVQVTHLKHWRFVSLLRTDIFDRAIPWTRLILRISELPADLNLDFESRLSALLAWASLVCLVFGAWVSWAWIGALFGSIALLRLNANLYRFFARQGGTRFAVGAVGLHVLYLLYSSLTFVLLASPTWLARRGLVLVMLATALKGATWSVAVPPWHAPDEPQHFFYGQHLERFGTWQVEPGSWRPKEADLLFGLIELDVVSRERQPLNLSDQSGISERINSFDNPAIQRTYVYDETQGYAIIRRFMSFHPPLYYTALAAVQRLFENFSILVRVLAGRWLSVVLGVATVAVAFRAGQELWPNQLGWPLLLATIVSFHPMFTFATSTVGNGALEIAFFSGCLLVSLRIVRCGLSWKRSLVLGCLASLGLLTKISFLSILPLLGFLVIWHVVWLFLRKQLTWRVLWPWALVALLPVLLSGWWYKDTVLSGGNNLVSSYGTIEISPSVRLLPYLLHYAWATTYYDVVNMYWGIFGWLDTPMPGWLLVALFGLTLLGVCGTGWWLIRQTVRRVRQTSARHIFAVFFLGCAALALMAFYTYLDFRMARDLGGRFGIQGRYYLPPIIGQMVWLALGLSWPVPYRLRSTWMWSMGAGMITLNLYALLGVVLPRYYGQGNLGILLERATILQPVSITALLITCVVFLTSALALAVALWGTLVQDAKHLVPPALR